MGSEPMFESAGLKQRKTFVIRRAAQKKAEDQPPNLPCPAEPQSSVYMISTECGGRAGTGWVWKLRGGLVTFWGCAVSLASWSLWGSASFHVNLMSDLGSINRHISWPPTPVPVINFRKEEQRTTLIFLERQWRNVCSFSTCIYYGRSA